MGLVLCFGGIGGALGDPPAGIQTETPASSASSDAQGSKPTGSFFSSLKQAFKQDIDHEVVRGHFDVGMAPDTHRYYCLVDPKTGKKETNGVGGQPVLRSDGMTGIKEGAVSFYSCADAEQQGNLVTTGYVLSAGVSSKIAPAPPAQKQAEAPAVKAASPGKIPPSGAVNELMARDLIGADGKEIRMLTVEYIGGGESLPHRHNAQVFVYVLNGSVRMQVQGSAPVTLGPGETFYEAPEDTHTVSANASQTKPARILVFIVKDKKTPVSSPVASKGHP
jgi:quercetin dioxygenase-like cupin family protein